MVILSGAGISAESGLKTFRDSDGLWEGYDINEVATPGGWRKDPALVLDFYNMRRRNVRDAVPQCGLIWDLRVLKKFLMYRSLLRISMICTNGAGSTKVLHLHGEIFKMRSEFDENSVSPITDDIRIGDKAPDGGQYRPHIVWFEEPVPLIADAGRLVHGADIFLIIGTSLAVYPAAGLIDLANPRIPKFILDKNIPLTRGIQNLYSIQKKATEGMQDLVEQLTTYC
ncbi:MAG: Sir2 family NAD-dependent protein deacetylase [Puia sp.]